jgi:hypothetical protein
MLLSIMMVQELRAALQELRAASLCYSAAVTMI